MSPDDDPEVRKAALEAWAGAIGKPGHSTYSPYSRCKDCLTMVEWRMTRRGTWIPLQPGELPRRRIPARAAWHEEYDGLMRPGAGYDRCRLIHFAVCPARLGPLEAQLDEVRRMLGVRGRKHRIEIDEDHPLMLLPNEYQAGPSDAAESEGALWTEEEVDRRHVRTEAAVSRWDHWLQVRPASVAELDLAIYVELNRLGERSGDIWRIRRIPRAEAQLRRIADRYGWPWDDLPGDGDGAD